jgi:hypothetical protein
MNKIKKNHKIDRNIGFPCGITNEIRNIQNLFGLPVQRVHVVTNTYNDNATAYSLLER